MRTIEMKPGSGTLSLIDAIVIAIERVCSDGNADSRVVARNVVEAITHAGYRFHLQSERVVSGADWPGTTTGLEAKSSDREHLGALRPDELPAWRFGGKIVIRDGAGATKVWSETDALRLHQILGALLANQKQDQAAAADVEAIDQDVIWDATFLAEEEKAALAHLKPTLAIQWLGDESLMYRGPLWRMSNSTMGLLRVAWPPWRAMLSPKGLAMQRYLAGRMQPP